MSTNITLAQALCTRLCHDLSGSIGAVFNGFFLMENISEEIRSKAKAMAQEESQSLVDKINIYRVAYGLSDADSDMSLVKMEQMFKEYITRDVTFNLDFEEGILMLDFALAKLVLCMAMVAYDNIFSSGSILIQISTLRKKNHYRINISAHSKDLNIRTKNLKILQGKANGEALTVSNCREFYIYNLCQKYGFKILIHKNLSNIEYHINSIS